ncbi:MAG: chloride channel protein [Candidatus Omnitrophica bacterium]|nr:chloride channel protein [Candidatus Omnitrophota bacterium]MDE2214998.1 chloride channel protein [Candidatus Omnitrophota bacterium]MDE2232115.1 chloride channel protein [Candidatus Omnitrophota bacterium]
MAGFNLKDFSIRRGMVFDSGVHFVRPMLLAVAVGVGTGFLVVAFIKSILWMTAFCFNPATNGTWKVIFIPAVGGLLAGPLIVFFAPEAKGHGVPEVLKAIALRGARIRPIVTVIKAVASVLSIGAGFSVGREGPIVQSGAALGSSFGQWLKLPEAMIRNLVACGAGAGIAGVFNTPIAGVMFASEVILRDFGASALSTVVVAAVSSSIISRIFLGDHPSFSVPAYHLQNPQEIFLYFGLGILSALAAVSFMSTLEWSETKFENWKFPDWLKPACAGLLVGCLGFVFPQIFGSGLPGIQAALNGNLPLHILLSLVFVKIVATAVSLGGGSSGGVFAPLLFTGAVLGGSFGRLASMHYGFSLAPDGAYALVGMASTFAAAARAPITSILIVFELTGSYGMILPIMVAVVTATSIAQIISKDSIYLSRLKRKGIDIKSFEESRVLEGLKVSDAMTRDFQCVHQDTNARQLVDVMSQNLAKTIFVTDRRNALSGMIKSTEINNVLMLEGKDFLIADDIAVVCKEHTFADEPLNEVAQVMAAKHLTEIAVVDTFDTSKIIGVLKSDDIFRVYAEGVSKREEILNHQAGERMLEPSDTKTFIFTVTPRSPIVGKLIKELNLPPGVHFNLVKRSNRFAIPHGNLLMEARDQITVIVMAQQQEALLEWLKHNKLKVF